MTPKTGIMICGHGSRDPQARVEFDRVAAGLRVRLPNRTIATGYLEFAQPDLRAGFEALAAQGVTRILAQPAMLFTGTHMKDDLPAAIGDFAARHPGIEMQFGRELSAEPKMLQAAAERIAETDSGPRSETLLIVVGRGARDPAANAHVAGIARQLRETMGFGAIETSFAGTADPLVEPGLRRAAQRRFHRIVVFPYLLFTGVLSKRVGAAVAAVAADHPAIAFVTAQHFRDHPLVIDCFADRITEMEDSGD